MQTVFIKGTKYPVHEEMQLKGLMACGQNFIEVLMLCRSKNVNLISKNFKFIVKNTT